MPCEIDGKPEIAVADGRKREEAIDSTCDGRKRRKSLKERQRKKFKRGDKDKNNPDRRRSKEAKKRGSRLWLDRYTALLSFRPDCDIWRKYVRQRCEGEGFDIDVYPGPNILSDYQPVDYGKPGQKLSDVVECAKLALAKFNTGNKDNKGVPYAFQEIKNAVFYPCAGYGFLITFEAREAETNEIKTFQADVFVPVCNQEKEVVLVRLKTNFITY